MKNNQWKIVVIITASLLLSISCGGSHDSPAPGCNTGGGCFPVMGGCFGKTVILDLAVTGGSDCLNVRVNNCNGGVITIENGCEQTLVFGEIEIPLGVSRTLDVRPMPGGQFAFVRNPSNFSEFTSDSNQYIEITGTLGDQTVQIAFIKTAPLCE